MIENASPLVLGTLGIAVLAVAGFWRWTAQVVRLTRWAGYELLSRLFRVRLTKPVWWLHGKRVDIFLIPKDRDGWWLARLAVLTIGTVTPSIGGLLLARGVEVGWKPATMLTVVLVVLGLLVLFHGNWYTLLLIAFVAATLAVFVLLGGPAAQLGAVVALSWILLLGGLRLAAESAGRSHQGALTGPGVLQEETDIPAAVWVLGFLFIALSATIAGARWLLY